jgi:hypothetical protein
MLAMVSRDKGGVNVFAKLFASITESSLWSEPKEVRLLFVSMLARADQTGFVEAAIPGLARLANLSIEETEAALECLMSPDKYSKNTDFEGRRIAPVAGGYLLLNYETYRSKRDEEQRREYMREYMAQYRKSGKQPVNSGKQSKPDVSSGKPPLAEAEAEAEADKRKNGEGEPPKRKRKAAISEIVIPQKANTEAVHAAVDRWRRHLDSIAVSHALHCDNSPQLEAMFQQASRMGEAKFVESIDWNIANGRHQFSEKWDSPHGKRAAKWETGADPVWMRVQHVLTSTDDTPSGFAERERLLTPEQREAVKRCKTRTRLANATHELDRRQIGEEFLQTLKAVQFERNGVTQ